GAQRGPRSRKERGQDALLRVELDLKEVIFGSKRDLDIQTAVLCETCEGSCCAPGTSPQTCDICNGSGSIQRTVRSLLGNVMTSSPCGTCRGFGTVIQTPCPTCQGQGRVRAVRTAKIEIPAGVDTGLRIQLPGQGEIGPAGGPAGDLFLEIKVKHHDIFSRNGDDLLATLEVQMTDAILGTRTTLKTLDGEVAVDIKPGTQSAEVITIKDRGVTRLRGNGRGDLKIGVQVTTPSKLSHKEQELIKQFAGSRRSAPPTLTHFQQGLFQKLRDRFLNI
ncbi:DnaJ C-terminal domain-containing protein, partial [Lacisediminihabitans sp.]|uniref:DnaJ C-terminal domain-containing protein n=1 Tax=Lacisediminihabitans sp. TaxID=2787631 RepID=UPI00374D31EB